MTRCLRVSRAYSWVCLMRNSTTLIFVSFIGIMTLLLHLYAFKREDKFHYKPVIGDFDYRPGAFLKGRQPNENISYCEFNYGLPYALNWSTVHVYKSPDPTANTNSVIYNAVIGTAYANVNKYDALTYATQATPEFLFHIVEIARYWDGPISLAVFVPDYDLFLAMQIMNQLCHCYSEMSKVSLHLFYPTKIPPTIPYPIDTRPTEAISSTMTVVNSTKRRFVTQTLQEKIEKYKKLNKTSRSEYIMWVRQAKIHRMMKSYQPVTPSTLEFNDCSGFRPRHFRTYRRLKHMFYPINVGRNVARNASKTNYFIVSDIEMVPSEGLAPKFLKMVNDLMGREKRKEGCIFSKSIFVVPLFEVVRGEPIPRDKDTLALMVAAKRASYFHAKTCPHCQRFPGLQTWLSRKSPDGIEPMMIAHREYPYNRWEPLYIGTQKEPWYNEMLVWEGLQDKMTQMLELCLQNYRLIVLDGGFLCHAASAKKGPSNAAAVRHNNKWYNKILVGLKKKYPEREACRLFWGVKKRKRRRKGQIKSKLLMETKMLLNGSTALKGVTQQMRNVTNETLAYFISKHTVIIKQIVKKWATNLLL